MGLIYNAVYPVPERLDHATGNEDHNETVRSQWTSILTLALHLLMAKAPLHKPEEVESRRARDERDTRKRDGQNPDDMRLVWSVQQYWFSCSISTEATTDDDPQHSPDA